MKLLSAVRKAVLGGYGRVTGPGRASIEVAMDCEIPLTRVLFARNFNAKRAVPVDLLASRRVLTVSVEMRCRTCYSCERRRGLFWQARAVAEFHRWERTWMGTFTLSPDEHDLLDWRCEAGTPGPGGVGWKRRPSPLGGLTEAERFEVRASHFYDEVNLWFKRLKSGHGKPGKRKFRYLLIAEAHNSEETDPRMKMRPHFHCLLHETEVGALVEGDPQTALTLGEHGEMEKRWYKTRSGWREGVFAKDGAFIRTEWKLGFTKFQLCQSPGSAAYVCAYLTKAVSARVRNSQRYGFLEGGGVPETPSLEWNEVLSRLKAQATTPQAQAEEGVGGNSKEVPPASEASPGDTHVAREDLGPRADGGS